MFYFFLGWFWASLVEWLLHRFVLHDLAAKVKADFHLEHHLISARNKGKDSDYTLPFYKSAARIKEILALVFIVSVHFPFFFWSGWFFLGNALFAVCYYGVHYLAHRFPRFGWRWFPWHMEHHLVSAKKNFGVTLPFWDWVFGTLIIRRK